MLLHHFLIVKADCHNRSAWCSVLTNMFSLSSQKCIIASFFCHILVAFRTTEIPTIAFDLALKSFLVFLFFHIPDLEWTRFLSPNVLQFALSVYILPSRCRLAICSSVLMSSVHLYKSFCVFFSFFFFFVIHTPFSYVSKLSQNNESRMTKADWVLQLSTMTLFAKLIKTTLKCSKIWFCIHFLSLFFSPESVLLSQCFLSLLYLFFLVLDISIKVNCNELVSHNLAFSLRVDQ